ncbi:MAG TPA: hypothetical protein PKA00_02080 [Saprospiraceae bacterium]|nr:hypothetical protein [Saprospiraceae bacterium]HMQ81660.1 hypothetical protein [Saprospiraceae bacterium]
MSTTTKDFSEKESDHYVWNTLFTRQTSYLQAKVWDGFFERLYRLGLEADRKPDWHVLNDNLHRETGWGIHAVNGLVPAKAYLTFLSRGTFPVNPALRSLEDLDHAKDPDFFHDVFGHLHLLFIPEFANYIRQLSRLALIYLDHEEALSLLAQFNKWTTEYGLIQEANQLRIYGAGLVSSYGEIQHVLSDDAEKWPAEVSQMLKTKHQPAQLQPQYFVIPSFGWLAESLPEVEKYIVALKVEAGPTDQ